MAKQVIGIGNAANDGSGDPLRTAGDKINDNFNEFYTKIGDGTNLYSLTFPNASAIVLTTANSDAGTTTTSSSDADHVLINDGGVLKKITPANLGIGGGGLSNVVNDTAPQLGGDLDVNGKTIMHTFNITASGSNHYVFADTGNVWFPTSENDPTLYLRRGEQYKFNNISGGHPIRIQSTQGSSGTAYNVGVTNNAGSGAVIFKVPMSAPATLYYQCTSHANMNGTINIV